MLNGQILLTKIVNFDIKVFILTRKVSLWFFSIVFRPGLVANPVQGPGPGF
jgi:hypothetical protein